MIVNNFKNDKGKPIANQFIISFHDWEIFQSYSSIIAVTKQSSSYILLDEKFHNYSKTTSRYLYLFLIFKWKKLLNFIKKVMAFKGKTNQSPLGKSKKPQRIEETLDLNQEEIELLLQLIKASNFSGEFIEKVYNVTYKLQVLHNKLNQ